MSLDAPHASWETAVAFSQAPPASAFPAYPAAWYLFGPALELQRGPRARRMLGRDLVAFRTDRGHYAVLDAHCSHLGANLSQGRVVGETIQCPYHHWRFGCDGVCTRIPSQAEIPVFARQRSYPVVERHGFLFLFLGSEPFYPLPFFEGDDPRDFVAGTMFSFEADASWYMVAGQGFDRQHFTSVHDRLLLGPPEITSPNPYLRCNRYVAENIGDTWRDRILRRLVGRTLSLTVQNWGGTFYLVKAQFPRACSRFLVSFRPLEDGRTHFDAVVLARRGWAAMGLPLRRLFTRAHLVSEARQVRDTEYRPGRLITADADLVECFQWLAALPQTPASRPKSVAADLGEVTPRKPLENISTL